MGYFDTHLLSKDGQKFLDSLIEREKALSREQLKILMEGERFLRNLLLPKDKDKT